MSSRPRLRISADEAANYSRMPFHRSCPDVVIVVSKSTSVLIETNVPVYPMAAAHIRAVWCSESSWFTWTGRVDFCFGIMLLRTPCPIHRRAYQNTARWG